MRHVAPISVAIITLDEESNVGRCLDSVAWVAERVVVDAGSTDRTRELCLERGARFERATWNGYVAQKNHAIDLCCQDWVLCLDADEWLTPAGALEIQEALRAPKADGFALNRETAFIGRRLSHAWSSDWQLRLFRRDSGRFVGGRVHERVRLTPGSRVQRLGEKLQHAGYASIGDYVERMNRYTALAAADLADQGLRPSFSRIALSPMLAFLKVYVLKRGYLDGVRGLLVAGGSGFYALLKYAKLWERHQRGPGTGQ